MENNILAFRCSNNKLIILEIDKIVYFEKSTKKIIIHLETSQKIEILNTSMNRLSTFLEENNLLNTQFFRSHCSFIVNIRYIKVIKNHTIILNNYHEDEIPISYSKKNDFKNTIRNNLAIFEI
jgi:DNA-binding LytR/AlgR family response regulator